jgi:hypothetical protein
MAGANHPVAKAQSRAGHASPHAISLGFDRGMKVALLARF